jgi:hypothetical protein
MYVGVTPDCWLTSFNMRAKSMCSFPVEIPAPNVRPDPVGPFTT